MKKEVPMSFILMGLEFNDIWRKPDYYVREIDDILIVAKDHLDEATTFNAENAIAKKEYLNEHYNEYTWYIVCLNE